MKHIITVISILSFFSLAHIFGNEKNDISGFFLFRSDKQIIYYTYDDDELDESTPISLYSLDMHNHQIDTIYTNSLYNSCTIFNSSSCFFSTSNSIFKYNFSNKSKVNIYKTEIDDNVITKLATNENSIFFFETNFSTQTIDFRRIEYPDIKKVSTILDFPFSELESSDIKLYTMRNYFIFNIQNDLFLYDIAINNMIQISSQAVDFSLSGHSIVYSTYVISNEGEQKKVQLKKYDINSKEEEIILNYPFKIFHYDLFSRLIDGKYQTYFYNVKSRYVWNDFSWIKEDIYPFLIYEDKEITVFENKSSFNYTIK